MRPRTIWLITSALVLALPSCTSSPPPPAKNAISATPVNAATIRRTNFQVTYILEGQSGNGAFVELVSNSQLSFIPRMRVNTRVTKGDTVGRTIIDPSVRAALQAGALTSSLDKGQLAQLGTLQGPIVAPVSGVFEMIAGRPAVRDPGVDVTVGLLPIQYLRYQSLQFSGRASIETIIGQRQVPCAAVWVQAGGESNAASGSPYELHCRLPSYVETAAGLRAQVFLKSALLKNVIVVPNIYVGYDRLTDGYFIYVLRDGQQRKLPITVGVTDGVVRVVTSPVPVGATLSPIPGG